ncbi:hypothetical protein OG21DRAFT_1510783 [Imleria badia]|nr:hypothetical protein OG21DRAFT_1510783 [Imleria badia]
MNISLRQVKMDPSQTMFITSTGTVLFTSHTIYDPRRYPSTTVITSVDDHGSIVEVGLIKWNQNAGGSPSLCVGKGLMELRTIGRDDSFSTIFRGSDRRIYSWRKVNDALILAADGASSAPIAIAYDDAHPLSTVDPIGASVVLSIQPTGFHFLHEVVATFILFEQLRGKTRADYGVKTRVAASLHQGSRILAGEPRIQLTKDSHWTRVQHVPPAKYHDCQDSDNAEHHAPWLRTPYVMS